jgi:hypothetical protein
VGVVMVRFFTSRRGEPCASIWRKRQPALLRLDERPHATQIFKGRCHKGAKLIGSIGPEPLRQSLFNAA